MGDESDALPRGEFNQAMDSQRREMRALKDAITELKGMMQTRNEEDARIAFAQGERASDLRLLRADVDAIKKVATGLVVSVGTLAIWQLVLIIGRTK